MILELICMKTLFLQINIQVQMEYNHWDKDAQSSCYKTYWWGKTLLSMILVHTIIM